MNEINENYGLGWVRDLPDFRDYSPEHEKIKPMLKKLNVLTTPATLAAKVDLRAWCAPIEDQGQLGSCTANAGVGMIEFYEKKAYGIWLDASRLFLYKATRNLLAGRAIPVPICEPPWGQWHCLVLRRKSIGLIKIASFDVEPSAFLYAFAQAYQAINYYRLDPPGVTPTNLLNQIKTNLAGKLPSMFGFTVYDSISQANGAGKGKIPYPCPKDKVAVDMQLCGRL